MSMSTFSTRKASVSLRNLSKECASGGDVLEASSDIHGLGPLFHALNKPKSRPKVKCNFFGPKAQRGRERFRTFLPARRDPPPSPPSSSSGYTL